MKNIHLIPTDKPSRLCKDGFDKLYLTEPMESKISFFSNQNIYITSSEKPKVGEWILYGGKSILKLSQIHPKAVRIYGEPIILTDNKVLIQDGVQAIDDEFLEWFVKNPSCELVKIEFELGTCFDCEWNHDMCPNAKECLKNIYKIIIPKEESNKTHYLDELPNMDKEVLAKMMELAQPNLETTVDIAEKLLRNHLDFKAEGMSEYQNGRFNGIIEGIEWKKERMYSEEEVYKMTLEALDLGMQIRQDQLYGYSEKSGKELHKEWFLKFKK